MKNTPENYLLLDGESLTTSQVFHAVANDVAVTVSKEAQTKIQASHSLLNEFVSENRVIYGVNTSMGGFVNWLIPNENARELQENLISAVATNVGPFLQDKFVRASMLARLNSLAKGSSAISLENFNKLLKIYNSGIIPCIPSKGSLGASGDLGPLACIALVATGKWQAKYKGKVIPGGEALKQAGIQPMELSHKEGLSLINGTSAMVGLASILIEEVTNLLDLYDYITALTFEGLQAKIKPFNPVPHRKKLHPGQLKTAENIWGILSDSKMIVDERKIEEILQNQRNTTPTSTEISIEDAYSIRCTPHVIGPIRENLDSIRATIIRELNSCSDNPLIMPEVRDIFHNGHFHGQYIAMAMDHLSISLTTLSNLSDRRIDRFMDKNHSNQLPAFLCAEKPGLRLGLMGGQFMATSMTAENRSLCTPLSIQSLTSTADFQDIVSMGLIAARRAHEIYENTAYIIAFELICAAQAVEIRGVDLLAKKTKKLFQEVRKIVPYLSTDQCLTEYLEDLTSAIKKNTWHQAFLS